MRLTTFFIFFFQVVLVQSLEEVSGYLEDTITLPSGVDPSWTLSKIEWSIFSNNTWIATYRSGKKNTERIPRYKGRLSLDTSSGNLMIHNLTARDEMEYTVDLVNTEDVDRVNKIQLTVKQRLQTPTIQKVFSTSRDGVCLMVLDCSCPDTGVNFSWHAEPPSVDTITRRNPDGSSSRLSAFINTTQNYANFTCTCSRNMEKAPNWITPKCDDDKPQPTPEPVPLPSSRDRNIPSFFIGGFLGGVITALLIHCFGGRIKAAWQCLEEKLRAPKTSVV